LKQAENKQVVLEAGHNTCEMLNGHNKLAKSSSWSVSTTCAACCIRHVGVCADVLAHFQKRGSTLHRIVISFVAGSNWQGFEALLVMSDQRRSCQRARKNMRSKNLKQSAAAASCLLLTKAAIMQARAAKQAFGHHRAGVYQQ